MRYASQPLTRGTHKLWLLSVLTLALVGIMLMSGNNASANHPVLV